MAVIISRLFNLFSRVLPERIFHWLAALNSSKKFLLGIIVLSGLWIGVNLFLQHPWDDIKAGAPFLVLIYTIYFGIDAGVTKVVQAEQMAKEHERSAQLFTIAKELRTLAKQSAKNQAAILTIAKTLRSVGMKLLKAKDVHSPRR
jgi:hypothetical protein